MSRGCLPALGVSSFVLIAVVGLIGVLMYGAVGTQVVPESEKPAGPTPQEIAADAYRKIYQNCSMGDRSECLIMEEWCTWPYHYFKREITCPEFRVSEQFK